MSDMALNRHDLLEQFESALGSFHDKEKAEANLIEAISATQTLLGILISLYKEVTGTDITMAVTEAILASVAMADD